MILQLLDNMAIERSADRPAAGYRAGTGWLVDSHALRRDGALLLSVRTRGIDAMKLLPLRALPIAVWGQCRPSNYHINQFNPVKRGAAVLRSRQAGGDRLMRNDLKTAGSFREFRFRQSHIGSRNTG